MVSKVRDFLMDEGFIEYVLGVSPELVSQWEAYFQVHPEDIREAVLLAPPDVACGFSMNECNDLKDRIISSIR